MAMAVGGPSGLSALQLLVDHLNTLDVDQATKLLETCPDGVNHSDFALTLLPSLTVPAIDSDPHPQNFTIVNGSVVQVFPNGNGGVTQPSSEPRRTRRALNNFMAYRAYMNPLLPNLPQARKSTLLSFLWKRDINHVYWTLIAAGYTVLRDNFVLQSRSLTVVVTAIATNLFNFPPPDVYIYLAGWSLDFSEGGISRCFWFPDFSALNIPQQVSVSEIVWYFLANQLATIRPSAINMVNSVSAQVRALLATDTLVARREGAVNVNPMQAVPEELSPQEVNGAEIAALDPDHDIDSLLNQS